MSILRQSRIAVRYVSLARFLSLFLPTLALSTAAVAGSLQFGDEISGEYKITLGYASAMRMEEPSERLINGPVDLFVPRVLPPNQLVGFDKSGLSTTMNFDDGNRNFAKHSLINNRATLFSELNLTWRNYGAAFSGSAFYDRVYNESNDNDSPLTINKTVNAHNEFSDRAVKYNGQRARVLDAYIYGDWGLFDDSMMLNVRVGQHLAAWGESLFFPGIASAQGPNDATKAFVPGAEIKEILLPTEQVSMRLSLTPEITLLGQYKFEYESTEVFPVGDYFSPADAVGPGAEFIYGSNNPAFVDGCPGLLPPPLDQLCNQGGIGGPLLNAPRTVNVVRGADLKPDSDGQWGVGLTWQALPDLGVGVYHIRYHDFNPTVKLTTGFPFIGEVAGIPLTTALINQPAPIRYNVEYFSDIKMTAGSFSTVLFGLNVGGEIIYREGAPTQVQAKSADVRTPVFTRSNMYEFQLSSLFVTNPRFLMYDEWVVVTEIKYLEVDEVEPIRAVPGLTPVGDGSVLFLDDKSYGYQLLTFLTSRNIIPGWDLKNTFSAADILEGNPALSGSFGALFGEGDQRLSAGISMQYLQNLEFAFAYNWLRGDPSLRIAGDSYVPQNPYADRDYITLNIKYNL